MTPQDRRHLDAARHSEALAAAATIHLHARCPGRCAERMTRDPLRWRDFARMTREDRAADYAGQPPSMPGPIERAGIAACYDRARADRTARLNAAHAGTYRAGE